jgi:FemAB-related protein (PEP-CTERM system-associated)
MSVEVASSAEPQAWDRYVTAHRDASMYHLYGWRDIFREAFGCQMHYLVARSGRQIKGVLPLFMVGPSLLGGNYISSLPGGVCADDPVTAQQLVRAAIQLTRETGARYLWLREVRCVADGHGLETRTEYEYVIGDIPRDPDTMWKRVRRGVRQGVRRARREGLVTVWGNENLGDFYRVHATAMRDLGSPAVPRCFFERALEQFPGNARVMTVYLADQAIAGRFSFGFNGVLHCTHGPSLRRFFKLQPNDLSDWTSVQYACEHGYREVNLGRSPLGSGHAAYKEKYHAVPREMFYQSYLNTARASPEVRGGRAYRLVRPIWRHLPVPVANALSTVARGAMPLG